MSFSTFKKHINSFWAGYFIAMTCLLILTVYSFESKAEGLKMSVDKRFIDNGDRTITDTKTGLMWMQEDSYLHSGHWLNWYESIDFVKKLNEEGFANYFDWQFPTVEELLTLHEPDKLNSAQVGREMKIHIDPIFAIEGSGSIWSIEPNGVYNAFGVVFNTGKRFNGPRKSRSRKAVRAVRHINP